MISELIMKRLKNLKQIKIRLVVPNPNGLYSKLTESSYEWYVWLDCLVFEILQIESLQPLVILPFRQGAPRIAIKNLRMGGHI